MSSKARAATPDTGVAAQRYDLDALMRLMGAGTATYLSYWALFFAVQRAFSRRPDTPHAG